MGCTCEVITEIQDSALMVLTSTLNCSNNGVKVTPIYLVTVPSVNTPFIACSILHELVPDVLHPGGYKSLQHNIRSSIFSKMASWPGCYQVTLLSYQSHTWSTSYIPEVLTLGASEGF